MGCNAWGVNAIEDYMAAHCLCHRGSGGPQTREAFIKLNPVVGVCDGRHRHIPAIVAVDSELNNNCYSLIVNEIQ